jgi:hypothetical protein
MEIMWNHDLRLRGSWHNLMFRTCPIGLLRVS